jgi:hypothetical protein
MHTIQQAYKAISLIRPQTATATVTGTGVSIDSYLGDAAAIVNLGAASGTSATCIVTIQGSADDSTYTTITTFGTLTDTSDNKLACGSVALGGYKYVRAVATLAGTSPSFLLDCVLMIASETASSSLNSTTAA